MEFGNELTIAPALYKLNYDPNTARGRGAEAEMLTRQCGVPPIRSRKPAPYKPL
jgi:hypothetical protein